MLRVLLALEDYGELMFLQTVLKKIGFDVDSTQNPRAFADALLTMNPDVLVMTALGKRIKAFELLPQVKRVRGLPKVIVIRSPSVPIEAVKELDQDAWLDGPVSAPDLLKCVAEQCGLNNQMLQDKLLKLRMQEGEVDVARILKMAPPEEDGGTLDKSAKPSTTSFGLLKPSTMNSSDRQTRFKKFLDDETVKKTGFSLKDVQAQVKALRADETKADLEELERQRRAFVEHLFKKKIS